MRAIITGLVAVAMLLTPSGTAAQEQSSNIEAFFKKFRATWRNAWNRRDTEALGALMADDVDWIAADGTWLKGRKAWREHHDHLFARQFKAAKWKLLDERVQMIDSTVAITISATQIEGDTQADGGSRTPRQSVGTRVITRESGRWLLQLAHNTMILAKAPK